MSNVIAFRKFGPNPEDAIQLVHGPITPAEVYKTDNVRCLIRLRGTKNEIELRVYRISPFGVELTIPRNGAEEIIAKFGQGAEIDVQLKIGSHASELFGLVVVTRHQELEQELLGIRWFVATAARAPGVERRASTRWTCSEEFLATGMAPNPVRFNDFVQFRVRDISKNGMQITTSLRNKFLLPGMILESTISFPMVGQITLFLKILNARLITIHGKEMLALGTQFLDPTRHTLETLGQYLLQFAANTSARTLLDEGYLLRSVSCALDFRFVKTAEQYREVLELRKQAYGAVGKIDQNAPSESTGDVFDVHARIITAHHHGRLVGSVRLMFHDPEHSLEHEQFMQLPADFPRKDEMVEVTRVCTDPAYRGQDLFYALMKQMTITIVQSKRRWLLGSATAKLMPVYERIGFRGTGHKYTHKDLGNEEHELILADVPRVLAGVGVGPTLWNELYSDVSDYLTEHHDVEFDSLMSFRMATYRAISPFTSLFTRGIRSPKKGK